MEIWTFRLANSGCAHVCFPCSNSLIVVVLAVSVDPALVNRIRFAIAMSEAHLDNAKNEIVKSSLG